MMLRTVFYCARFLPARLAAVVCQFLAGMVVAVASGDDSPENISAPSKSIEQQVAELKAYQPVAGPWGTLKATTVVIEPPDRLVTPLIEAVLGEDPLTWEFEAELAPALNVLADFGIDEKAAAEMVATDRIRVAGPSSVLFEPSEEFLCGLSAEQRRILYPYVAPFRPENLYHAPIALHRHGFRFTEAVSPSGLSPATIDRIDSFCYQRRGNAHLFSDLAVCLRRAADGREQKRVLKTLNRQFSMRLQLRVAGGDDVASLLGYWGGGGRNKAIAPLLESVAATEGVEMLDIVHLLPPAPRRLLHAFPVAEMVFSDERPDCFSTAVSFFADEPPSRYLDSIRHVVEERYEKVSSPYQFGDLILMSDPDSGEMLHACNYIAADVVFTKNGSDTLRPWVFSTFGEVMSTYLVADRLTASFFRLKDEYQR